MRDARSLQRFLKNIGADITFEMLQIMSCLWYEQGISQQILAERTAKDKACLTNLMLNLERKGYVCRREDTRDRRNKLVFLTEEGERFRRWMVPQLQEYYQRLDLLIGEEKLKQIENLLKEVQHALETY